MPPHAPEQSSPAHCFLAWPFMQARTARVRQLVAALRLDAGAAGAPAVRLSSADVGSALVSLSTLGQDVLFEAEMEALVQVCNMPSIHAAQRPHAPSSNSEDQGRGWHAHSGTMPAWWYGGQLWQTHLCMAQRKHFGALVHGTNEAETGGATPDARCMRTSGRVSKPGTRLTQPAAVQSLDLSCAGASLLQLVHVVRALARARHATARLPALADALAAATRGGLGPWPPRRTAGLLHAFAILNFPPSRLLASSSFSPSRLLAGSHAGGSFEQECAQALPDVALDVCAAVLMPQLLL